MKQRFAPFLVLLEARYAPLLFAVAPQSYAVYLWLWRGSDRADASFWFAIAGALGYELVYVGAIAWAEEGRSSFWTWATAAVALAFSIVVAFYVYRAQGAWAWLHAGFPLVAFTYTLNMHSKGATATAQTALDQEGSDASAEAQALTEDQVLDLGRPAGYVYIFQSEGAGCKIGCAGNVEARFRQVATPLPFALDIVYTVATDDMYATEARMHRYFEAAGKRLRGEWFKLTSVDLSTIKSIPSGELDWALDQALELLTAKGLHSAEFDGAFWLQQATAKKPDSGQAVLDVLLALPLETVVIEEAHRYTCPHCGQALTSKQALGAAVKNGYCLACKRRTA